MASLVSKPQNIITKGIIRPLPPIPATFANPVRAASRKIPQNSIG
jgi:hypothetical protein